MPTLDELITKYSMDSKGYEEGADKVGTKTKSVAADIDRLGLSVTGVQNRLKNFGGGISGTIGGVVDRVGGAFRGLLGPIAGLVGGAGLVAAGGYAVNAAMSFDTLERSMTAVVGSAEKAKAAMAFVDQLAVPSVFTSEDLATAATRLEAFQLQTQKYLPVVEKLGTVFGATKDKLMQFVEALGFIRSGRYGEGFQSLSSAGISREALTADGLKFDKSGEFKGSVTQALDAITAEVNARFGRLSEQMASGPAAKMGSFMDAVGRAARSAGFAILTVLMPAVEKVSDFLGYLVSSGVIDRVANSIAHMFNGGSIGDALVKGIAYVVASIQAIPVVVNVAGQAFNQFFHYIFDNLKVLADLWVGIWTFTQALSGIQALMGVIKDLRIAEEGLAVVAVIAKAAIGGAPEVLASIAIAGLAATAAVAAVNALYPAVGDSDIGTQAGMVGDWIDKKAKGYISGWKDQKTAPDPVTGTDAAQDAATQAQMGGPIDRLASIERNTKETAENTRDHSRSALGGGNLGRIGVTVAEMNAMRRNRDLRIHVSGGHRLESALEELIQDAIRQAVREGHIQPG